MWIAIFGAFALARPASADTGGPMYQLRLLAGLVAAAMSVSSAWAQGNGNGHSKAAGPSMQTADAGQVTLSATITAIERQTIFAYFQQHQASYAGMKPLPPVIAKKIARGGSLPPGIAKRYFPNDLIAQLPARPGQQWVIVGTDVLLVQAGTNLILDLLARVF